MLRSIDRSYEQLKKERKSVILNFLEGELIEKKSKIYACIFISISYRRHI